MGAGAVAYHLCVEINQKRVHNFVLSGVWRRSCKMPDVPDFGKVMGCSFQHDWWWNRKRQCFVKHLQLQTQESTHTGERWRYLSETPCCDVRVRCQLTSASGGDWFWEFLEVWLMLEFWLGWCSGGNAPKPRRFIPHESTAALDALRPSRLRVTVVSGCDIVDGAYHFRNCIWDDINWLMSIQPRQILTDWMSAFPD